MQYLCVVQSGTALSLLTNCSNRSIHNHSQRDSRLTMLIVAFMSLLHRTESVVTVMTGFQHALQASASTERNSALVGVIEAKASCPGNPLLDCPAANLACNTTAGCNTLRCKKSGTNSAGNGNSDTSNFDDYHTGTSNRHRYACLP